MKKSRLLVCGSTRGELILQDPRSLSVEHRIQAHTGTISDLDVSGNLIVTCGFSERQGTLIIDPLVKVYDMRNMRSLAPIPFPNGPSFLKMHPKLSATVCIASQTGQFQLCDVGNLSTGIQFYQVSKIFLCTLLRSLSCFSANTSLLALQSVHVFQPF